jgi:hypothetical protein
MDRLTARLFDVYAINPRCRCTWERFWNQPRYHMAVWSPLCPIHRGRPVVVVGRMTKGLDL